MTKLMKLILIIGFLMACLSNQKLQANNFVLTGKTNGVADGTKVELIDILSNETYDSTLIENDEFEFKGSIGDTPVQMIIMVEELREYKFVWIEANHMFFDASASDFRTSKVSGSSTQTLMDQAYAEIDQVQDDQERQQLEMAFVAAHPNSIASASILSVYATTWGKEKVQELFDKLSKENKENAYGKDVEKYLALNKNPQVGDQYIDFEMQDQEGMTVKLSDYLGKVTLLEFWASWCGPCRQENPNLVNTYQNYKEKGFEIFGVSIDAKKESWQQAIRVDKLAWKHVSDLEGQSNKAGLIYGVNGIPANFLIDQNGNIAGRNLRGDKLNEALAELLH